MGTLVSCISNSTREVLHQRWLSDSAVGQDFGAFCTNTRGLPTGEMLVAPSPGSCLDDGSASWH